MADCKKIVRPSKRVCAGALNKRIVLYNRNITPPEGLSVDFGEDFAVKKTVWALVETVKGLILFDQVNTARDISHRIFIRFMHGFPDFPVTAETWIGLLPVLQTKQRLLDVIRVENMEEENRFYMLSCSLRGVDDVPANFA